MSISATSNYMSNADILVWMEEKTEGLYGNMTAAMSSADNNSDAEAALNKIKGDLANFKAGCGDSAVIHDELNDALAKYGDVPGIKDALQPMADKVNELYGTSDPVNVLAPTTAVTGTITSASTAHPQNWQSWSNTNNANTPVIQPATSLAPEQKKIPVDAIDGWTDTIGKTLDTLGKQDQLALINIQEINSEINQAKQTASALMDAADKSASAIINHIS